ncbi:MAG: HEPN domain-containing protein [Woeseia sp.]
MSEASETFLHSIGDAENLLRHFDSLNTQPPPPELEVLKRAGLVMAMTAWETYVEDRLQEATAWRLSALSDRSIAAFVQQSLAREIKRLHNPAARKTIQLFRNYAGVDLWNDWCWEGSEGQSVRDKLNELMQLRGEVVHRSRPIERGDPAPHPVRRDDLESAIAFLKSLVQATEKACEKP